MELSTITKMYDDTSYFDQYSGTVLVFVIITLGVCLLISYFQMMVNVQPIINDWTNQRCKPTIMPFAGLITHPEGVSAGEYTAQNFNYCMQNILSNLSGTMLEPLTFVTNSLTTSANQTQGAIQGVRGMFDKVRTSMQSVTEEIMGRLMNVMIPLIQMVIGFKDLTGKIQGTLTAALYTSLGAYYTMKSLMGAIAQMIVTILIILAALIAGLWVVPITWGAAAANTVIFTAIAVPMAIILTFMNDTMHVNSGLTIPTLKCFDKNTRIPMDNGTFISILEINVGEKTRDDGVVTAKIKVETKGSDMFILHNVLVSDSHLVQYNGDWVRVSTHPEAVKCMVPYEEPYLYCLNTENKTITLNGTVFSDWDEKSTHTCVGFPRRTKVACSDGLFIHINKVQVGSVLKGGEKVYGMVEQDSNLFHLLTDTGRFEIDNLVTVHDYNG